MSPATHKQRSVGLSKHRGPRVSLLSLFRDGSTSADVMEKDEMEDPEDINRLPEPGTDSDDSDSARHTQRNRDLTSFTFEKPPAGGLGLDRASTVGTRRRHRDLSRGRSIRSRRSSSPASRGQSGPRPDFRPSANANGTKAAEPRAESPPSSAGSKRPADEDVGGEHLDASLRAAKRKKPATTYGRPAHKPPPVPASKASARPGSFPFVATYIGLQSSHTSQ